MASGVLGTAASGLISIQRAISVTGHNISNVNTEGYTKQRVEFGARVPEFSGAGYIGRGVQVKSIERVYDKFLTDNLRSTTSASTQFSTFADYSSRISNILGDADAGLGAVMGNFFNSIQGVADDPASIPARQTMMTEAETMVGRFHALDQQLGAVKNEINQGLDSTIAEINSLSTSIAESNKQIVDARSLAGGNEPNDLLDARDNMINRLAEMVNVSTVSEGDGAINVFIGTGQSLVTRYLSSDLELKPNVYDANKRDIAIVTGGASSIITSSIKGGELGAILDFGNQVLDSSQNALGRIAITLSSRINEQQKLGIDLNNSAGQALFSAPEPKVATNTGNIGSATVSASFDLDNLEDLTTRDYVLEYSGSDWRLTDSQSGELFGMAGDGSAANPFKFDGLSVVVSTGANDGDQYLISPTRNAANDISMVTSDVQEIAAAAPLRIGEQTDANGAPINTGTALMSVQQFEKGFGPVGGPVQMTFDVATNTFNYSGALTGSFAYDPASDSGKDINVSGIVFKITGDPAAGDVFTLAPNTDASGDNTNALALADLQTALTMEGGGASFSESYQQLIGEVGTRTRTAQISADAQTSLQRQAQATRDGKSGVNLDEEAANLLRFQQAYQALAQVVNVANETFQTLINAVGR
ncbi:MAG: flagellar hook-associated protein FlgK [Gammaproteobacteria bacterium]